MLTAAIFYWVLNAVNVSVNIRNVCVFLAPIFSANASIASYLLTTEVTNRSAAGLLAAAFTAIVPSYISRSVGGSYDNEGVAIFALIFTFYLWVKSVHTGSMMWSCFCALSYYYMVAAWGGYVFIINVIPIYTILMLFAGRYSSRLYIAYSIFYCLGSLMAMTVPFVGFNVVQQAECAGSHGVFVAIQAYALASYLWRTIDGKLLKNLMIVVSIISVVAVAGILILLQLMGKMQWTGRSLTLLDPTYASKFLPIIASVSEHQPTTWTSFFFDLHVLVPLAPIGLVFLYGNPTDGAIFVILYGTIAWYFAGIMVRLMLTLAPIACILAAIGLSTILTRFSAIIKYSKLFNFSNATTSKSAVSPSLSLMIVTGGTLLLIMYNYHATFVSSEAYSSPSVVIDAGRYPDGRRVMYDDYREAYFWLRQNTHPDSKILSWWDYGYQMSAMANRTVLVDNNTWNNTHIATVGRALASTEENAYPILESLDVDYVLVIFGGLTGYSSDDINKFLWPVRIGSGVYPNDMPNEKDFYANGYFDIGPGGAPALLNCVCYKLCYYRFGQMQTDYQRPPGYDRARQKEVGKKNIELTTMEEAFTSEHWIVRIYKVKRRPNVDPIPGMKKKTYKKSNKRKIEKPVTSKSSSSSSSSSKQQEKKEPTASYVGCYGSENYFIDKIYEGGSSGANYNLALHNAVSKKKKYFAIAKGGADGHAFAFSSLSKDAPISGNMKGEGCETPCLDDESKDCGCIDSFCQGPKQIGEEHNRRWIVYKLD